MFLQEKKPRELFAVSRHKHWTHLAGADICAISPTQKVPLHKGSSCKCHQKYLSIYWTNIIIESLNIMSWNGPIRIIKILDRTTQRITPNAIPKDHSVLLDISAANKALTGHKRHNNS